ncbi:MAG: S8 family serine peptidase [Stackebrandtia sp.]
MTSLPAEFGRGQGDGVGSTPMPDGTGRYVLVLADAVHGDEKTMRAALKSVAGISSVASATDFADGAVDVAQTGNADATLFPALGIAVVGGDPDRLASLNAAASEDERIESIEPEGILYAVTQPTASTLDYLRGYRDAATELYQHANGDGAGGTATVEVDVAAQFVDTAAFTWGLQATKASTSQKNGQGVRVAMLDTGFDLKHADFIGRPITAKSFVSGQTAQDGHGHGTHVTGTSSGPAKPPGGHRRYGIAYRDNIFIGKVLSNQGSGTDEQILAGIEWAIRNSCRVISMSLGKNVATPSPAYDKVGQRALAAGSLIIAAAGNNANRPANQFGFVIAPANSLSIMAVGALDSKLGMANFSARSTVPGCNVDIVGPGVAVDSSWPMTINPKRYHIISGTSMATPHVAGIAALLSAATGATGLALWGLLVQTAQPLPLLSIDVGAGLVQAPQ